jgi:hypothetical protein
MVKIKAVLHVKIVSQNMVFSVEDTRRHTPLYLKVLLISTPVELSVVLLSLAHLRSRKSIEPNRSISPHPSTVTRLSDLVSKTLLFGTFGIDSYRGPCIYEMFPQPQESVS